MDSSQFTDASPRFDAMEAMATLGATCDTYRVKLYGKLHFLKRLKAAYAHDVRYQEALRKEFETGYRLEHPHLVRYVSMADDAILMEYVDGETLSQRLATRPNYFRVRKNADKFVRQLLDVVGYLHAHQVLHLDLKPDNIMLTRIGDDLKLVDPGCYTDTFVDTPGHTDRFAAPEQLAGGEVDERSDIFAIGRILCLLPVCPEYRQVAARCTAERPEDRYQSVEALAKALRRSRPMVRYAVIAVACVLMALLAAWWGNRREAEPAVSQAPTADTLSLQTVQQRSSPDNSASDEPAPDPEPVALQKNASTPSALTDASHPVSSHPDAVQSVSVQPDSSAQIDAALDRLVDAAYQSTIASFCDSVFPSPPVGEQWSRASTEFHRQVVLAGDSLISCHPDVPASTIRQRVESRFQHLVSYVFNQMRTNGSIPH